MRFVVINEKGIHARPAMEIVLYANKFEEEISIEADNRKVDVKSILGLMSLGMYKGQEFTVYVKGPNEEEVMKKIETLLVGNGLAKRI
ncbi:MAG: HPr family phosphocarrier protein [Acholeplasmataceae bacterium]|jgi:phosphocarrier protein|nr:HPr family phosphocarrier protein [Acholeplasmataceae bacterium]